MRTVWVFLLVAFLPSAGFTFPDMSRHGYASCTACHVAPNGGGLLTPYGRQLSREILSLWGEEGKDSDFAHGMVTLPSWLNLGGDTRFVQTYSETPLAIDARPILMQADLEAGFTSHNLQLVATLGRQEPTTFNPSGNLIFSRRHYALYKPTDPLSIRAGKFMPAFGINTADHMISIKRGLGWDEGSESYNLEGSWLDENFDAFATIVFGRPDDPSLNREKGVALRSSAFLGDKFKVGGSYFFGFNDDGNRQLFGPYAVLGITPHLFALVEVDLENNHLNNGRSRWGAVDYIRVDYEFTKGFRVFATQEFSQFDVSDSKTTLEAYGLGLQFFPRAHFEMAALVQKRRKLSAFDTYTDLAWILLHYYL